jgi:threonine aldolase
VIAAAALYALDQHVDRLAEDHARARRLADAVGGEAETNFVELRDSPGALDRLRDRGVLLDDLRPGYLRAVTHLDITDDDVDEAIEVIPDVLEARVRA